MEQDKETGSTESSPPGVSGAIDSQSTPVSAGGTAYNIEVSGHGQYPAPSGHSEPTVPILQDLFDIPRQILPEETYFHLKNAGREAVLAVLSLANSINNASRPSGSGKTRKHIDVE